MSVLPILYYDIQKVAYVQRKDVSDLVPEVMAEYRSDHAA